MNIFEKIIKGEIPSKKILENEKFLAFYDIAPKAPVHILVVPKASYKDFNTMPPQLLGEMSSFILEVVEKAGIKESGYRLITNIGEDGGQEIPHFHYHVLGGGKLKWEELT
ncbi:histidine triad nucleotide-binding protein [Helicobacter mustelae]|uniref:HIT-family protein n=1 Tax=Helicobacter mustelae (strain ATCC 43772 / CCUG 25715 / CIP 103759 / LMG 18044 / NCTC 12198 / R85-136P) TaxID=679897 RepID=D3UFT5_HELM1|nr:histidine triad nucleotide-binding protein [Helicobacter mustelae]CBG39356.1 HIT-family protein [Helicobacter mustelae 12198]SQH70865.1 HIT-family protein [Helicobacter mustelae]STP11993.1 HIT-family protein [Helicobacter mustelae]